MSADIYSDSYFTLGYDAAKHEHRNDAWFHLEEALERTKALPENTHNLGRLAALEDLMDDYQGD